MFFYSDYQNVSIKCDDEYGPGSDFFGMSYFEVVEDVDSKDLRNRARTFFGETLLCGNRVTYSFDPLVGKWSKADHVSLVKELTEELNLKCTTRKDINSLEFKKKHEENEDWIILDALSRMKHDNITRISLPVSCFTHLANEHSMIKGNILNGFPNLTEIYITSFWCGSIQYLNLDDPKDIFVRFVQQFSSNKNPTIFFESPTFFNGIFSYEIEKLINTITKYNVQVKFNQIIDCSRFKLDNKIYEDYMRLCSYIYPYITTATSEILYHKQILQSIKILETFENLSELHFVFIFKVFRNNAIFSGNRKVGYLGLRKLNNLKNVKLEYSGYINDHDSDILKSFYQFFEFTCLIMPRNVEILQLIGVPDINNATAKMITKYMPDIKLLNIECLSYKESDGLYNFGKLECLISYNYCPKKSLKL
uniref:F-box domain-containing protein n=1 Tax=Strongyloides papillosus TaxID=174720 RepID=A0A0N5BTI0_STREA